VGKAVIGVPHILDADGRELGPGEIGDIYFDGPGFEYHNDPEKTAGSRGGQGWSTLGDIGYLDEQGYLYLTDRRAHMIISGGVNIYPAEIENVLALHPAVRDVGVFGVPNAEFGEEVKAAVELFEHSRAGVALEGELIAWCRERLSHIKCPRSIDFHAALPRQETGKLFKHVLRKAYLTDASAS
jgi:long-chain acyl-CoA synthetase